MKQLKHFLQRKFGKGVAKQLQASRACVEFENIIKDSFGPDFKNKVKALHFKHGVLTIEVNGSVYAQEIHYKTHLIIDEINKRMGERAVKRVAFRT